jgi:hypothetical protein
MTLFLLLRGYNASRKKVQSSEIGDERVPGSEKVDEGN